MRRRSLPPLSVVSLVVIALFVAVAVLGYLITPDSTPYCNQQYLELACLHPGSKAQMLCVPLDDAPPRRNMLHRMLHGQPLPYTATPILDHHTEGDQLVATTYTGQQLRTPIATGRIEVRHFPLGTDPYGRCVLSMLIIGSRVSLSVGFIAIAIALLIGIALGALAGYLGGWVDNVIMWFINVVWSIPTVLLVIAITFALGKGFWQIFIAVGLTMWVDIARVVRGEVISIKEKEYIEATRALGFGTLRTLLRHVLPGCVGAITVVAASNFATAILLEAGLSFLGIGVQPPMPSWGMMVKDYTGYLLLDSAYLPLLPGVAIMLVVLAFMVLSSGLRDMLDVRRN